MKGGYWNMRHGRFCSEDGGYCAGNVAWSMEVGGCSVEGVGWRVLDGGSSTGGWSMADVAWRLEGGGWGIDDNRSRASNDVDFDDVPGLFIG